MRDRRCLCWNKRIVYRERMMDDSRSLVGNNSSKGWFGESPGGAVIGAGYAAVLVVHNCTVDSGTETDTYR